jgi:glycine hydroxymethyltransferase
MGTQEITRRGMKESEMVEVAEYIKNVVMDGKNVKEEVTEFMNHYTQVHYAFQPDEAYRYLEF